MVSCTGPRCTTRAWPGGRSRSPGGWWTAARKPWWWTSQWRSPFWEGSAACPPSWSRCRGSVTTAPIGWPTTLPTRCSPRGRAGPRPRLAVPLGRQGLVRRRFLTFRLADSPSRACAGRARAGRPAHRAPSGAPVADRPERTRSAQRRRRHRSGGSNAPSTTPCRPLGRAAARRRGGQSRRSERSGRNRSRPSAGGGRGAGPSLRRTARPPARSSAGRSGWDVPLAGPAGLAGNT